MTKMYNKGKETQMNVKKYSSIHVSSRLIVTDRWNIGLYPQWCRLKIIYGH